MKRHPPLLRDVAPIGEHRCAVKRCGRDALDPVHWPPAGWREHLLYLFGLLR